jgi:hypothetical protein
VDCRRVDVDSNMHASDIAAPVCMCRRNVTRAAAILSLCFTLRCDHPIHSNRPSTPPHQQQTKRHNSLSGSSFAGSAAHPPPSHSVAAARPAGPPCLHAVRAQRWAAHLCPRSLRAEALAPVGPTCSKVPALLPWGACAVGCLSCAIAITS